MSLSLTTSNKNSTKYYIKKWRDIMAFSIRLTKEERKLAESYEKLNSMSLGEAFKRALFEKIEDEYDAAVCLMSYDDYLKSSEEARPISELWDELGI